MTFIQMHHGVLDAQGSQDLATSNAQDNLLAQPLFDVTYVEMG
jgi:hypothetical protein